MKNQNKYLTYPQAIDKILQDMELVFKAEKKPIGLLFRNKNVTFEQWCLSSLKMMIDKEDELVKNNHPDLSGAIPKALHQMLLLDDKNADIIYKDFASELNKKEK